MAGCVVCAFALIPGLPKLPFLFIGGIMAAIGYSVRNGMPDQIAAAPNLHAIVYLSTIGVYGNHDGAWVDETTPPKPVAERSHARLAAEQGWVALGSRAEKAVAILRLSGIYGPGQNVLQQLARGTARRIVTHRGRVRPAFARTVPARPVARARARRSPWR